MSSYVWALCSHFLSASSIWCLASFHSGKKQPVLLCAFFFAAFSACPPTSRCRRPSSAPILLQLQASSSHCDAWPSRNPSTPFSHRQNRRSHSCLAAHFSHRTSLARCRKQLVNILRVHHSHVHFRFSRKIEVCRCDHLMPRSLFSF